MNKIWPKIIKQQKVFIHSQALGQARTAEVQRDARIGEAEAKQESSIAEAKAEMQRMEAALSNQTEIARYE